MFKELKRYFIYIILGSLLLSSITVSMFIVFGEFSSLMVKTIATIISLIFHCFISYIIAIYDEKNDYSKNTKIFFDVLLMSVVLSLFNFILLIWEITNFDLFNRIYVILFIINFAVLHISILNQSINKTKLLNSLVFLNYFFIFIVVSMLSATVVIINPTDVLAPIFFRVLTALSILDATNTITIFVLSHLYDSKNISKIDTNKKEHSKKTATGIVLIIFSLIFVLFQLFSLLAITF